jgi:hypothetical protein
MAKVHFLPYCAVKYVGSNLKELAVSTARPKPILKKGDLVIVDKRMGFNLVKKGFDQFEPVKDISFVKADKEAFIKIENLETLVLKLEEKSKEDSKNTDIKIEALETLVLELEEKNNLLNAELLEFKEQSNEEELPLLVFFENDKNKLETYAQNKGIELDKRNSIENMFEEFISLVNKNKNSTTETSKE